jgi:AcrR family transcriptional regulator
MTAGTGKSDLRIVKTVKVLNAAMSTLLERHPFRKITVWDICETAQISRATFYARFEDKYDFLKSWLVYLKPDEDNMGDAALNEFILANKAVIENLVSGADNETTELLCEFMLSLFNIPGKGDNGEVDPRQIVISSFFAGGMFRYFQGLVKNKFPPEVMPVNPYLREIIKRFKEWETEIKETEGDL